MIHLHRQEIRFSDIDSMGHVNNAIYLNYFEQARMSFFGQLVGRNWDWKKDGIVLAKNTIEYHIPIHLGDIIEIETECVRLGHKSMELTYRLVKIAGNDRTLCTSGSSVLVAFDYEAGVSRPIPELWRNSLKTRNSNL